MKNYTLVTLTIIIILFSQEVNSVYGHADVGPTVREDWLTVEVKANVPFKPPVPPGITEIKVCFTHLFHPAHHDWPMPHCSGWKPLGTIAHQLTPHHLECLPAAPFTSIDVDVKGKGPGVAEVLVDEFLVDRVDKDGIGPASVRGLGVKLNVDYVLYHSTNDMPSPPPCPPPGTPPPPGYVMLGITIAIITGIVISVLYFRRRRTLS